MLAQIDLKSIEPNWIARNDVYVITPDVQNGKSLVWGFDVNNLQKYNGAPLFELGRALGSLRQSLNSSEQLSELEYYDSPDPRFNAFMKTPARVATLCLDLFISKTQPPDRLKRPALELIKCLKPFQEIKEGESPTDSSWRRSAIETALDSFEITLKSEVPRLNIFHVKQLRTEDMTLLIENGEECLSASTRTLLKDFTRRDQIIDEIREGARCLACGFSNAVGLHIYRALEYLLIEYQNVFGKEYEGPKDHPLFDWYLDKVFKDRSDMEEIVERLRFLKNYYRNECVHNIYWDIDTACNAFKDATTFIEIIVKDIAEKKKGKSHE